jgi:Ankyrin repeats (many copies)
MNAIPGCNHYSTLLHLATHYGSLSTVKLLLQMGADINARNERSTTPLFNALKYQHDEVVYAISERITDIGEFLWILAELSPPYMQLVDISCRTLQDSFWSLVTTCAQKMQMESPLCIMH